MSKKTVVSAQTPNNSNTFDLEKLSVTDLKKVYQELVQAADAFGYLRDQTVVEVATRKGVVIKMTLIDGLIQRYSSGDVMLDPATCIDTMKMLMHFIAVARNKRKKVSHYQLHLEYLKAWCQLEFPDFELFEIAEDRFLKVAA